MGKYIYVSGVIALGLSLSTGVFAADGTVQFQGVVNAKTCTLDANSQNMTVLLPSVLSTSFPGANSYSTAPATKFTLTATGCDPSLTSAAAIFSVGSSVDSTNGNLNNTIATTSGGTDAQVRLFKDAGQSSPINLANFGDSGSNTGSITGGVAKVDFYANYFSKAVTAKPGLLKTSIQFSMQYL
ncbi:fimbrial protein [Serratia oryzae]|uniref:Fimbrial protein n=1 Tax=Serratia oryzae TaxID=2034155 RepID=A0A1S8CHX1_9GAMM|nr:fimbrial protein [Serratia oryzae]OMQ21778.1 hypothetical protein BMI79_13785 [Serratia oryzae]